MKPTKNRVYCNDCRRVKMLFPSQEKADNFIAFNAHEIMSEGYRAPERSYYCSSCGGWHVTKNPNNEYFQEQDLLKKRVPEIKSQIKELVRRFHTEYNKKEVLEWKRRMDRLKELYDEIGIQTNTLISFDELNEDVSINHIVSKTSITIDEKGTNGSSIRSTELETKDLNDSEQHIFLNRPFAFLIRDKETNNVLLISNVTNPNN